MMKHLRRILPPLIVLLVFVAAVWALHRQLQHQSLRTIRENLHEIPADHLWLSLGLTAGNYLLLIGYDYLAVRSLGRRISLPRVSLASFTGFVISYNIGALLGGTPVRYRLYSAWGFSAVEIVRLVLMLAVIFWVGLFARAGVVFLVQPFPIPEALAEMLHLPFQTVWPLGWCLLAVAVGYLGLTLLRHKPVRFRGMEIALPGFRMSLAQLAVSAADLVVAAGCLFVLMPDDFGLNFWQFLGVYLLGWVAVVLSHVPGGLAVFEGVVLAMATTDDNVTQVAAALLAFRVIYYLLPLLVAAGLLGGYEIALRQSAVRWLWGGMSRWFGAVAPSVLALGTLLAGTVMLLSGAMPAVHSRLTTLQGRLPLPLMEAAHFLASLIGACLLLVAMGLYRRLDSAYRLTTGLLVVGIVLSLFKGLAFEEAIFLVVILTTLVSCRGEFRRKGSLVHEPFTPGWIGAIVLAVGSSIWLGAFAHKHIEYSSTLWWRFAFEQDAPRFLRASVGVLTVLLLFAVRKLIAPAAPGPKPPDAAALEAAAAIVAQATKTWPHLALLGDKSFLFNEERTAFLMYAVQRRSWVALGDPVGAKEDRVDLVWEFRGLCDRYDGWPVFYQVDPDHLLTYLDQGLTLLKLGEEGRVALSGFNLDGGKRKMLRRTHDGCQREGCRLEVVPREQVAGLLPDLRTISDAWLQWRQASEKGFSLGSFDPSYLQRFPCALVRYQDRIVAFANLWLGAEREECSIDLMRFVPGAPAHVMDFLFIELMLWGRQQGYQWFNLGMTPLSGLDDRPLAPVWNRAGGQVYRHGDHFDDFADLRQYKETFEPVWYPKYLASPGGMALPQILADVTALIASRRTRGEGGA
jgi:phosphatidylglycerol lysyltransferase